MYAIVDIAGQQFKVEQGQEIFVHRLAGNEGAQMDFDKVLLIEKDGKTTIGAPVIEGAQVKGTILEHLKGDKVFVFKKKRRKGYKKFNGHRQYLSLLKIDAIEEKAAKAKKAATKKVAAEETEIAPETQDA